MIKAEFNYSKIKIDRSKDRKRGNTSCMSISCQETKRPSNSIPYCNVHGQLKIEFDLLQLGKKNHQHHLYSEMKKKKKEGKCLLNLP